MPELDPVFTTLVTTLAQRAAHGMVDAAQEAWSALVRLVRRKLGADPKSAVALAAVEDAPDDQGYRTALERRCGGRPPTTRRSTSSCVRYGSRST